MSTTFAQLGVPENICRALEQRGMVDAFEIQAATIADALAGRDVCGRAPTGSGKTLAFGIPLVATVERADKRHPRALILSPTRELAEQITTELRSFSGDIRIAAVYGGVGYGPQLNALNKGVEILVACPGRLEDLIERGSVSLSQVDQVVLDEADRMADMGFMPAVKRILDQTADKRQTVLFSATLDGDIAKLSHGYQTNPVRHEVGETTPDITSASHIFWRVEGPARIELTAKAVEAVWPAIIFCRTRHGADRLAKQLGRYGITAGAIHGGRSQGQRTRALAAFSKNQVEALVATDVAARGIHVDGVALVIHYDAPADHKDYVHRSGRTARAGEGGVVISMVQRDQVKELTKFQRQIGLNEPFTEPDVAAMRELSPGPDSKPKPKPVAAGGNRSERGGDSQPNGSRPPQRKKPAPGGSRNGGGRKRSSSAKAEANGSSKRKPAASGSRGDQQSKDDNRKNRRAHLQSPA
ncbi:MAG: superfamily II DNA/RNA helicase [Candidatus Poriferisodalaceae bacterium]|jgi:superfamily II DNA/RNA helicase